MGALGTLARELGERLFSRAGQPVVSRATRSLGSRIIHGTPGGARDIVLRPIVRGLSSPEMGEAGPQLAEVMRASRQTAERLATRRLGGVEPILNEIANDPTRNRLLTDAFLSGRPSGDVGVDQVVGSLKPYIDSLAGRTIKVGGQQVPFTPANLVKSRVLQHGLKDADELQPILNRGDALIRNVMNEAVDVEFRHAVRERGKPLVEAITQQFGQGSRQARYADSSMRSVLGATALDDTTSLQAIRGLQTATMLGTAVLQNLGQTALTALVAGIGPTVRATLKAATKGGREELRELGMRTGALFASAMDDFTKGGVAEPTLARAGREVLKRTGFNAVERMNRMIAAHAGRDMLEREVVPGILAGSKRAVAMGRRLGLDPAGVQRLGGLTADQADDAIGRFVGVTQFRTTPEELPLAFSSSGIVRVLTQFKSFSIKAAELTYDQMRQDPVRFTARALVALPPTGEAVRALQGIVRDPQGLIEDPVGWFSRDDKTIASLLTRGWDVTYRRNPEAVHRAIAARVIEDFLVPGFAGIFADSVRQLERGNITGFVAGPTAATLDELGTPVARLAKRGIESATGGEALRRKEVEKITQPLKRGIVRRIPVAGPALAQELKER